MSNYLTKIEAKYDHALDRMYALFKESVTREARLVDRVDDLEDELRRIKACPGITAEIAGLCDRALKEGVFTKS